MMSFFFSLGKPITDWYSLNTACLVMWLWRKKYVMPVGLTKIKDCAVLRSSILLLLMEKEPQQWSMASLSHCSLKWIVFFCFWKISASELIHSHCSREKFRFFFPEKPVQLIDFTRTVMWTWILIFFCFKKN